MQSVNLFELASQQAKWVAVQQKAVAANLANINTQGYAPVEVAPFKEVLMQSVNALAVTNTRHMTGSENVGEYKVSEREFAFGEEVKVNLQDELLAGGVARKAYELNTSLVKSFHRMILTTVRR